MTDSGDKNNLGAKFSGGRTLVIQPLPGIGDMVWHLPHIHAIAQTALDNQVSILTKRRSRADQLLGADPSAREVLWLERGQGRHDGMRGLWQLANDLRSKKFDTAWILHGSARYALATQLAGIPRRIGYGHFLHRLFLTHPVILNASQDTLHPIDKAEHLLKSSGLVQHESEPVLPVSIDRKINLAESFQGSKQPWIGVGIGSSEPVKQWGRDRFIELLCCLSKCYGGTLFLIGGPAEEKMGQQIIEQTSAAGVEVKAVINLSISDTLALLANCHLYVGNDTGFLNMAAAVGVHSVGVFGGSPPLGHSEYIHCVLPDDGSRPEYGSPYMDRISVTAVMEAVQAVLSDSVVIDVS